uniref:ER membrane protein complex subunit 4 n=1 Tax=Schistocephalus solidus TaxID=70667 RepID=A0A0V0JB99_SCHSO
METFNKASYSLTEYGRLSSRRWNFDFSSKNRMGLMSGTALEPSQPVGYVERTFPNAVARDQDDTLTVKRSWDIALAPLRQIPMNLLIMWMTGNSISIFPIMMVIMMFLRPIQAILSIQATFKLIEGSQAPIQCLAYLFGNLVMLALAVYKCHNMGLLPTYASDWLSFVEPSQRVEWSAGGASIA